MAAHQAPPSLGFSRQEHWSGLPFPSPKHKSEKWKWSRSVVSDSSRPHGLQPTRLLSPWDFPGKSTGVGCHCVLRKALWAPIHSIVWDLFLQLGFPGDSDNKESACNVGDPNSIPGSEDLLEKGMATHSSILAWRIPWTEGAWWAIVHGVAKSWIWLSD